MGVGAWSAWKVVFVGWAALYWLLFDRTGLAAFALAPSTLFDHS